jgi:hypothetical protein
LWLKTAYGSKDEIRKAADIKKIQLLGLHYRPRYVKGVEAVKPL